MDLSLNSHEARVLGVLIEKGYTTPDQYPLSLNATTNGCNQKSNRDPQVDFSEAEVRIALQGLRMKGLVGGSTSTGSRVEKYRHNAREVLKVGERAVAVLAELMLRGPQTAGELRTRAKRMRDIPSLDELKVVIDELTGAGLAREQPGGRATKYRQLVCSELHPDGADAGAPAPAAPSTTAVSPAPQPAASPTAAPALEARVVALESEVVALRATVDRLVQELGA
ncbi:MAG: YceH family protein [Planctomycetota bacterium]